MNGQQRPTIPEELRQAHTEDVAAVLVFLLYARRQDPRMMFGSRTVEEAFQAFCRLAGVNPEEAEAKL